MAKILISKTAGYWRYGEIFITAQEEAEKAGQKEFDCPLCGEKAVWDRVGADSHVLCKCEGCKTRFTEITGGSRMGDGYYQFLMRPNCIFQAKSEEAQILAYDACNQILEAVKVYYSREQNDILVEIMPNDLGITDVELYDFQWYDETIVDPARNYWFLAPEAWINLSREEFLHKIGMDYPGRQLLSFECDAYQICEREFENEQEREIIAQIDEAEELRRKKNERDIEQAKKELNWLVKDFISN